MADERYTVRVPDQASALYFPKSMTVEEVRLSLVATGHTSVENANAIVSPDGGTITFQRITGGGKGYVDT